MTTQGTLQETESTVHPGLVLLSCQHPSNFAKKGNPTNTGFLLVSLETNAKKVPLKKAKARINQRPPRKKHSRRHSNLGAQLIAGNSMVPVKHHPTKGALNSNFYHKREA